MACGSSSPINRSVLCHLGYYGLSQTAMAADEQRQEVQLDLAELTRFHSMSQRPRVRSLLYREIENLEGNGKSMQKEVLPNDISQFASSKFSFPEQEATKIAEKETVHFSNEILTTKQQEIIESRNNQVIIEENSSLETKFAEGGSKRKHREMDTSRRSKWEKMPKLNSINQQLIINKSSCKSTQEKSNQEPLQRATEQVLHLRAQPFDANESSPTAVIAIGNADICNQTSHVLADRNKQLEEDCNGSTCETNPGVPSKKVPSRSARRKHAKRVFKKEMKIRTGELHERENSSDANEVSPVEVAAIKNADICSQTSQVTLDRNKQLEEDWNGNTYETNTGVPPKKFPSRSARRKYAKRQLKKQMKNQARELHERANPSDANQASPLEVAAIQNADIRKQTSQFIPDRNKKEHNANTHGPNSGVSTGKFHIRSPRHEYAQMLLKEEMNKQARAYTELEYMQRNGGDVTTNEASHLVYYGHEPLPPTYLDFMQHKAGMDAVCLERLHQASSPARIEYKSHHPASASLSYSSSRYPQLIKPGYSGGGQIVEQSLPYKNNWNSASAEAGKEFLWKPTGNVAVNTNVGTLEPASTWFPHNYYIHTSGGSNAL